MNPNQISILTIVLTWFFAIFLYLRKINLHFKWLKERYSQLLNKYQSIGDISDDLVNALSGNNGLSKNQILAMLSTLMPRWFLIDSSFKFEFDSYYSPRLVFYIIMCLIIVLVLVFEIRNYDLVIEAVKGLL